MKQMLPWKPGAAVLGLLTLAATARAQVGIGTTNPDPSAVLHLQSTNRGLLPPRMRAAERLVITTPANGLLVFDTDSAALFMYSGNTWRRLLTTGGLTLPTGRNVGDLLAGTARPG